MKYRNLRRVADGAWVDVLFTEEGDPAVPFHIDAAAHIESVAGNLGVPTESLEAVDSDSDQRTGSLIALVPPSGPTVISYEDFEARFTGPEKDAVTQFLFEVDLISGKPVNPALVQALNRAVARNSVNLLSSKTDALLGALVAAGVITADRKTAILAL